MTRNEDDLRAAMRALEQDAPDANHVLTRVRAAVAARHRRRAAGGVAATAAVVAATVVVPLAVFDLAGTPDPDVTPPPMTSSSEESSTTTGTTTPSTSRTQLTPVTSDDRFDFTIDDVPGHRFIHFRLGPDSQEMSTAGSGSIFGGGGLGPADLHVIVHRQGTYEPRWEEPPERVDVGGQSGRYGVFYDEYWDEGPTSYSFLAVVWEYAPDSWAVVRTNALNFDDEAPAGLRERMLSVARAVRIGEHQPFLMPYRFGYLPAGLSPVYGHYVLNDPEPEHSSTMVWGDPDLDYSPDQPWADGGGCGRAASREPGLRIDVSTIRTVGLPATTVPGPGGSPSPVPGDTPSNAEIDGRPACVEGPVVAVDYGEFELSIVVGAEDEDRYDRAELERIIREMTFADDVNDPSTWFDLAD